MARSRTTYAAEFKLATMKMITEQRLATREFARRDKATMRKGKSDS